MGRRLTVLNYAVNGSGLGHVTRLIGINRWLERLALACGVEPEIYFLTTSEADSLVWRNGFASFKLPSKTAIKDSRIPIDRYLQLARQWVWNALNLVHPDLLIVDTFPGGSFNELLGALEGARHKVFVYREMKADFAARPAFQAMLPLYDRILIPHARSEVSLRLAPPLRSRAHYTGTILVRDREELLPRDEARARLGVPADKLAVYLSAGGGGDDTAQETLFRLMDLLQADPQLHLVVGAGPLYRGRPRRGSSLTWLTECDTVELLSGIDLAISASGYNSFSELMYLGIPTVFYAQEKVADIQEERLQRAVEAGAACRLPFPFTDEEVLSALAPLRESVARASLSEAARKVVSSNGARVAAAQILSGVLPPEDVEEALEALTPRLIARMKGLELSLDQGLQALRLLGAAHPRSRRRQLRLELEEALEGFGGEEGLRQAASRRYPDDLDGADVGREVLSLLEAWRGAGVPPQDSLRLVDILLRRLKLGCLSEASEALQEAMGELVMTLGRFQDWRAAPLYLQAIPPRPGDPVLMLSEAQAHLEACLEDGRDLYSAMATLGVPR